MEEIFLGVMGLQEAKNHQIRLKEQGIHLNFKTNGETCTTGCKVTVEVWGLAQDEETLREYFKNEYLKHLKGHNANFEHLTQVYDPNAEQVVCQACGTSFRPSPNETECPDCGLVY